MKIVRTANPPSQTPVDISGPGAFVFAAFTGDSPSKLQVYNKIVTCSFGGKGRHAVNEATAAAAQPGA